MAETDYHKQEENDKRFLVFACDQYYPNGGMADMVASFDTLEEALDCVRNDGHDWQDIYDRMKGISIDLEPYGIGIL